MSLPELRGARILSPTPEFNTEILSIFSGIKSSVSSKISTSLASPNQFPILLVVILIVAFVGLYIWYTRYTQYLETPENVTRIVRENIAKYSHYGDDSMKRVGLTDYLTTLYRSGLSEDDISFTNFYISTVNVTGFFFPAYNGVFSPAAVKLAVLAGARAFVFDIWPDLFTTNNSQKYRPTLQIVEDGSQWRRISLNMISFSKILETLVEEALITQERPGNRDPVVIYLRFRGKMRNETFDATYQILENTMSSYRLDPSFNNCRGQDRLFRTPIRTLMSKIIVVSNTRADNSNLSDFINIGPTTGIKQEWLPNETRNQTHESRLDSINKIKQNISFVAPYSELDITENNDWNYSDAMDLGIHCIAMNFWNPTEKLKIYFSENMFGKQSFKIKPEELRYKMLRLDKPMTPPNPKWGKGENAGKPREPKNIKLPV